MDPKLISVFFAGVIGLISSLVTVYWLKPIIDKKFHLFQLEENYKHEQAKKIRETIGKYRSQLINSGELLNNRLQNFARNYSKGWIEIDGDYENFHHYIDTTVHRFLAFFAYIKLIEENLEYLDTTNSESKDLEMIRYFRIFIDIMTDVQLFENSDYDSDYQTDHFFRNRFDQYVRSIIVKNKVLNFNQFESSKINFIKDIKPIYEFFDGITKDETRLRLERLKCFHCVLIGFLNSYGYDFQNTDLNRVNDLKNRLGEVRFKKGTLEIINKYKLKRTKNNLEMILNKY